MRLLWSSLVVTTLLLGPGVLALADPAVKQLSAGSAQGTQGPVPELELSPGTSINLSFIETGEIIRKVWLENPSLFAMSFDGPTCLGDESASQDCTHAAATVIHVKVRESSKAQTAASPQKGHLLTVVTTGAEGRKLYHFRLRLGLRQPAYHTIAVMPDNLARPQTSPSQPTINHQSVLRGLVLAQENGLVQKEGMTWNKVQQAISLMQRGASTPEAAEAAGIPTHILQKLGRMGTTSGGKPEVAPKAPVPAVQPPAASKASTPTLKPAAPQQSQPTPVASKRSQLPQPPVPAVPAKAPALVAASQPTAANKATRSPAQQATSASPGPQPTPQSAPAVTPSVEPLSPPLQTSLRDPNEAEVLEKPVSGVQQATALVRGLGIARNKGQIGYQSPLWNQVQGVIKRLRLGDTRKDAAQKAKVDLKLVDQLLKWGGVEAPPPEDGE